MLTGSPSSELPYRRGVRYTYRYSTTVTTTLHGSSGGRNGLALDCVVDIDVVSKCHLMMQVSLVKTVRSCLSKEHMMLWFHALACPTDKECTDKTALPSEGTFSAEFKNFEVTLHRVYIMSFISPPLNFSFFFLFCFTNDSNFTQLTALWSLIPSHFGILQLSLQWMRYSAQTAPLVCFSGLFGAHLVFLFPRESLERSRLKFSLRGGKVTALCLQEGEQVWALNIKRALLSMLQTSPVVTKVKEEREVGWWRRCSSQFMSK